MRKNDVALGQVYAVKLRGRIQPVRLVAESPNGGWVGRNKKTGREIRIRSAAKLRARLEKNGDSWKLARTQAPQLEQQSQQALTDQGVPY